MRQKALTAFRPHLKFPRQLFFLLFLLAVLPPSNLDIATQQLLCLHLGLGPPHDNCIMEDPSCQSNGEPVVVKDLSLTVEDSQAATDPPEQTPPHRSHDPQNNLKRSDPFQFGSRFLSQEDNV